MVRVHCAPWIKEEGEENGLELIVYHGSRGRGGVEVIVHHGSRGGGRSMGWNSLCTMDQGRGGVVRGHCAPWIKGGGGGGEYGLELIVHHGSRGRGGVEVIVHHGSRGGGGGGVWAGTHCAPWIKAEGEWLELSCCLL